MNQNALDTVATLFLMMAVGFALKKRGTFTRTGEQFTVELLQKAAIPAVMFQNGATQFSQDFLAAYYPAILASFLSILVSVIAGLALSRSLGIPAKSQGIYAVMFSFSNTILIGIPVITGLFGEAGIPYLMLYYLTNTMLFWTIGVYLIGGEEGSLFSWRSLRKIFNPVLLAFLAGLALRLSGSALPSPVMRGLDYLSDLVTPLSTLYMGSVIAALNLKRLPGLRPSLLVLCGRFLITPFLTFALLRLFGFSGLLVKVLVIASALPVMTQVSVLAAYYGKEEQHPAFMLALTTLLSLVALPIYLRFL